MMMKKMSDQTAYALPHGILHEMYKDFEWDFKRDLARQVVELISSEEASPDFLCTLVMQRFKDLITLCRISYLSWARHQTDVVAFEDKDDESSILLSDAFNTLAIADSLTFIYAVELETNGDPQETKPWLFLEANFVATVPNLSSTRQVFSKGAFIAAESLMDTLYDLENALMENTHKTVWALVYPE